MAKKKTYTDEELANAIKNNKSIRGVLDVLNLKPTGGNYKNFYSQVEKLQLDVSHFTGQGHATSHEAWNKKLFDEVYCVSDKRLNFSQRKFIFKEKLLGEIKCNWCDVGEEWNSKPLTLHIDHINGKKFDNRLENLRLLCPNCHSQTDTYCGLNKKNNNRENGIFPDPKASNDKHNFKTKCNDCDDFTYRGALRCRPCNNKLTKENMDNDKYPDGEELLQMVNNSNLTEVSKQLNVSRTSVRNRLKKLNLYSKK